MRKMRNLMFAIMIAMGILALNTKASAASGGTDCSYSSCSALSFMCDVNCWYPNNAAQDYEQSSCNEEDDNYGGTWNCYYCYCYIVN